jgi:phosphonoacetaldehyde hydrolase
MNLKAIIFDWAGTTVDFGCLCPVAAFQSAFARRGVTVAPADIHQYMGLRKREHIQALLALPEVANLWKLANRREPVAGDVEQVYRDAEKSLVESVHQFASPTPNLLEAVESARRMELKIGSTTGYTASVMQRLAPTARVKGYMPDSWVAADQVPQGRPWPWMIFKSMEEMGVCPPGAVIKVGDTVADVEEGINAGTWTVGVVESSSLVGKSTAELDAMRPRSREMLFHKARRQFVEAGVHFVIQDLSKLESVIERVESRLENGVLPPRMRRRSSRLPMTPARPAEKVLA